MRTIALAALLLTGCFQHRFGYLVEDEPETFPMGMAPAEVESRQALLEQVKTIGALAALWYHEDLDCFIGFSKPEDGFSKFAAVACRIRGKPGEHEFIINFERKGDWQPVETYK